MVHTADDTSS